MVSLREPDRNDDRIGFMFRIALYLLGALTIVGIGIGVMFP